MSELIPAKARNKDPLEVVQNILLPKSQKPRESDLIPQKKIPSVTDDIGNILDEIFMVDRIGEPVQDTGQALPSMAAPFGKATKLKGAFKKTIEPFVAKISNIEDIIFKTFKESNQGLANKILRSVDEMKKTIADNLAYQSKKVDKNEFSRMGNEYKKGDFNLLNDVSAYSSAERIESQAHHILGRIEKDIKEHSKNTMPSRVIKSVVDKFTDEDPLRPYGLVRAKLVNAIKLQQWDVMKKRYNLNDIEIAGLKKVGEKANFELTPMRKIIDNDLIGDNIELTQSQIDSLENIKAEINYFKTTMKDIKEVMAIKESGDIFEIPQETNVISLIDAMKKREK